MTTNEKALLLHREWQGKLETVSKAKVASREDLALAYTPGVAEPCKVIAKDKEEAYTYTWKSNTIAVVSDGSAVLGLGNIGPYAAMPVMEGKAVLFKEFGGVNAVPICLDTQDTEEIIQTVKNIAPGFGGINLEDISAPRCFEIEERLKEMLDIPVFHDDQHLFQPFLNLKAAGGRDVLQVDAAECGSDVDHRLMISSVSWVSRQMGTALTPPNSLKSTAFPLAA